MPNRSEADKTFLRRQRDICLTSLGGAAALSSENDHVPAALTASPSEADCGPRALLLLCQKAHLPATLPLLRKTAGVNAPRGASLEGLSKAAKAVGFAPQAVQMDRDALANLSAPAIAWVDGNHYVAVYEVNRSLRGIAFDTIVIHDPNKQREETLPLTDLLSRSGGVLLTLPTKQAEKRLAQARLDG